MQIAVIHYMVKEPVRTKRSRSEFFAPAQGLFFLPDLNFFCSVFVLFLLLVNAAHAAAGAASAVAAGAGQAAFVFGEVPDHQHKDEHNDHADENRAEIVFEKSKHENHLLIRYRCFF